MGIVKCESPGNPGLTTLGPGPCNSSSWLWIIVSGWVKLWEYNSGVVLFMLSIAIIMNADELNCIIQLFEVHRMTLFFTNLVNLKASKRCLWQIVWWVFFWKHAVEACCRWPFVVNSLLEEFRQFFVLTGKRIRAYGYHSLDMQIQINVIAGHFYC